MEHKSIPAFVKVVDEDQGIVDHIFAVMGNVDAGLDVIHNGAFKKTLSERGHKVRVLDHHNAFSVNHVIGKPVEIREIGKDDLPAEVLEQYPDATGGVQARTQFLMDTPEGKGAFIRLKNGAIDEWSFGYDVIQSDRGKREANGKRVTVRNLRELKLYEYSPVIWGMNPATTTLGAKAQKAVPARYADIDFSPPNGVRDAARRGLDMHEQGLTGDGLEPTTVRWANRIASGDDISPKRAKQGYQWWQRNERFLDEPKDSPAYAAAMLWFGKPGQRWFGRLWNQMKRADDEAGKRALKAITPFLDLPLAERDRAWDSVEAESRIRAWAGGEDNMDWEKYSQAFMWYDDDDMEMFGAYKLQYADIIDDDLLAVPRAIFTIANPQRGVDAADIPADDKDVIKTRVSQYYDKMAEEFNDPDLVAPWDKMGYEDEDEDEQAKQDDAEDEDEIPEDETDEPEEPEPETSGMIALYPDEGAKEKLAGLVGDITGAVPVDELHLTLAHIPDTSQIGDKLDTLLDVLGMMAMERQPLAGQINGLGRFFNEDEANAFYAIPNVSDLPMFRQEICFILDELGIDYSHEYGFVPHITLAYLEESQDNPVDSIELMPVTFEYLCLVVNGERHEFPFGLNVEEMSKAGRVFSRRNAERIGRALIELHSALEDAGLEVSDLLSDLAPEKSKSIVNKQPRLRQRQSAGPARPPTNGRASNASLLQLIEIEEQELDMLST